MPDLEDTVEVQNTGIFGSAFDDEDLDTYNSPFADQVMGAEADFNNMEPSTVEPTKIAQALDDEIWVEAMQEELLQFKIQKVWTLVDLPYGKKAIGTKWVYTNKKDERGIVVRNKGRLVAQGYKQEEGIDYDDVFAPVARIKAIRLFLAYASFMNYLVYQMDVRSASLYGTIEEEVYVSQPPDVEQIMHKRFQMSLIGELTFLLGLQVKQKEDGIFISQDKYVGEILKKFGFSSIRTANTPMETNKALTKDEDGEDVDVHLYRSMIVLLMYLTSSAKSLCMLKISSSAKSFPLECSKKDLQIPKGKSTTGGCQFLGSRLISWQCKKQTVVANSTTEAEYIAASHYRGQVLWIQNQMLDYGYNFMQTKIHVDNESVVCVVKNLVYHSKTKHIEIQHHFIRDTYEKRLIEMVKIHTDNNVADLLTKAFVETKLPQTNVPLDHGADEAVHKEGGDNMERDITTAASLDAAQDSDNIIRNQTMAMPNVDIPQGIDTGGSPRSEDTMGVLLLRLGLRECLNSSLNHLSQKVTHLEVGRVDGDITFELRLMYQSHPMIHLSREVLDLEKEKDVQAVEILRIENRVKRLETQRKSSTSQPRRRKYRQVESLDDDLNEEDASKQGRSNDKTKPMLCNC
ncbi:putative ribonuclease H-like domain-containing protein [Tanacetum coccineum]